MNRPLRLCAAAFALLPLAASCSPAAPVPPPAPTATVAPVASAAPTPKAPELRVIDPLAAATTPKSIVALCDDNLELAEQLLDELRALDGKKDAKLTFENTLGRLDDAFFAIGNASEFPYLMGVAHPDEKVREAARACEGKTDKLVTGIFLDPKLARVLEAYAATKPSLSGERGRFLEHTLRDFKRNGTGLPEGKKARLRELNQSITITGQKFVAAIASSTGSIEVPPVSLRALPETYRKAHPVGPNGKVKITTDYPDYFPFVTYSGDRKAALELYKKFVNRGGFPNVQRLEKILELRHEKALLLGYPTWADYAIEPRMAKSAKGATAFLERVSAAIDEAAKAELKDFRKEWKRLGKDPKAALTPPDRYYLTDRLKSRKHKLDSKALAEYFEVDAVTKGLLAATSKMYGVTYKPVKAPVWHADVKGYDVVSDGKVIGRFFLDLHSRPNKYKHAAMFSVRSAKKLADGSVQTPVAALVCNFPRSGKPMPHTQVVTYFHEFGHVLHHLLSDTELASTAGTNTVRDFVEAPSQMFEEWAWSREVLDLFARHPKTGKKIPAKLLDAMRASRRVGLALATQRQLFLARLDLGYHGRANSRVDPPDTTKILKGIHAKTFAFEYVPGTHFQSSFGHLIGYDAGYYGYQWALSLAHDVLSRFKKEGLLNPKPAADWRAMVLSRGGSRDERGMIKAFLGREPSEKAYVDYLRGR